MRNLTARRCQHEGCFTVANFGLPGDKPGYCAAHSTEGVLCLLLMSCTLAGRLMLWVGAGHGRCATVNVRRTPLPLGHFLPCSRGLRKGYRVGGFAFLIVPDLAC